MLDVIDFDLDDTSSVYYRTTVELELPSDVNYPEGRVCWIDCAVFPEATNCETPWVAIVDGSVTYPPKVGTEIVEEDWFDFVWREIRIQHSDWIESEACRLVGLRPRRSLQLRKAVAHAS